MDTKTGIFTINSEKYAKELVEKMNVRYKKVWGKNKKIISVC